MKSNGIRIGCRAMLAGAVLAAAALLPGCATTGDEIEALQTAQRQYEQAQNTPRIDEFASRNMREAERNLRRAESLAEEGASRDEVAHYAFLAEHHVAIAEARLNRGLMQDEIRNADQRRQQLMLAAQQRQAERNRAQATQAQQRADEAEAQLALREEELQQTQQAARQLAEELDQLKVEQQERGTVFTLSDVVFDVDSDQLNEGGERSLRQIAEALKQNPDSQILVEGYTDSTGSEQYNQDLSRRRAEAVKESFVEHGIPPERIRTEGHGEQFPVASNDTPQGRQLNRRVEIVVSDGNQPVQSRRES